MHSFYITLILIASTAQAMLFDADGIDACRPTTSPLNLVTRCTPGRAPDWALDLNFRGIWYFEEPKTQLPELAADSSFNGNTLDSTAGELASRKAHQACRSNDQTADLGGDSRVCTGTCDPTDFRFNTGEFTAGCWLRPNAFPSGFALQGMQIGTDGINGNASDGWNLGATDTGFWIFKIDLGVVETILTSASTYALNNWYHHIGRYNSSIDLMEQIVNGLVDANTGSSASPGISDVFGYGVGPRMLQAVVDECWAWAAAMQTSSICRIAVCGIDGCGCRCNQGTPANYDYAPTHTSFGGPLTCTLPPCDQAGPIAITTTTTTSTSTSSTTSTSTSSTSTSTSSTTSTSTSSTTTTT